MLHHHEVRVDIAGSAFTAFVEPEKSTLNGRFANTAGPRGDRALIPGLDSGAASSNWPPPADKAV